MSLFVGFLSFILGFLTLVIAITVHEFAHAATADRLGDPTPKLMGRLTLNPLAHLDPIGTILILVAGFGWGKPVQFDPFNLKSPRRDAALISLAGPITNLLLAFLLSSVLRTGLSVFILTDFLRQLILINIVLAFFNLLPIYPLDGFGIVEGFLPEGQARDWHDLSRFGLIFLLILILPLTPQGSLISILLSPPIDFFRSLLLR